MTDHTQHPGLELARKVRSGFILRGTSLTRWCRENDIDLSNARQALYGTWNGQLGKAMRVRIMRAAGLEPQT